MTTILYFAAGLAVSVLAVLYLLYGDEKRQRVFRIRRSLTLPHSRLAGWTMVFLPGLLLVSIGELSAFLSWCGAITVCAWLIVSRVPVAGDGG